MIKQLLNELQRAFLLAAEKLGFYHRVDQVKETTHDLASQYQASSPRTQLLLISCLVFTAFVFLAAVIFNAWNSPTIARFLFLPVPVAGYKVEIGKITDVVGASGVVQEHADVDVTSRITANVKNILVKIGDVITKDTPLIEVDRSSYEPALTEAQQAAVAAQANVGKYDGLLRAMQELQRNNLAADVEVQEAMAAQATARQAAALAQKQLADAQLDLDFTSYKSPINGIVLTTDVNAGDTLIVNKPVLTLGILDTVYFVALVQEDELPFMAINSKADVIFSSLPSQTFHGSIEKIDPTIDPTSRTFKAYVAIDNHDLRLKPGITGFARVIIEHTGLAIPESAVINQYGETANVFVVNSDNHAVLTPVVLGLSGQNNFEVISGLKEGDVVVSAGTIFLKDNEHVHVTLRDQKP